MTGNILHTVRRFILLVIALQVLNLSTNSIDFQPIGSNNLTEFNDLNTVTEYFAEVVLGYKNAFPESKEKKSRPSPFQKNGCIKLFNPSVIVSVSPAPLPAGCFYMAYNEKGTRSMLKEINPPPPKA